MVLIVVLFFACTIGVGLFYLISSGTTIAFQNKKTVQQLQAYYLAHSALQHTALLIRLLPREVYAQAKGKTISDIIANINSEAHNPIRLIPNDSPQTREQFDLFIENPPDPEAPYAGTYQLEDLVLEATNKGMTGTQDSYKVQVKAVVYPNIDKKKGAITETIEEDLIVSRFSGG